MLSPLAAAVLSWSEGVAAAPREACPATALWAPMEEEVPDTKENRRLRRRIAWGLAAARQADEEPDEIRASSRCLESVLRYEEAISMHYQEAERAVEEHRRVEEVAHALRSKLRASVAIIPPPATPTPSWQWHRRDRRLVAHTSVSGVFTGVAALTATMPWAYLVTAPCTRDPHGCESQSIGAFVTTMVAIPVGLASTVSLAIWASRLARHRRMPAPGLTWPGRSVGLVPTIDGVRLSF